MINSNHVAAILAALAGTTAITILIMILWRIFRRSSDIEVTDKEQSSHKGNSRIRDVNREDDRRGSEISKSEKLFSWMDHPYLAIDAVENGWPRFAFNLETEDASDCEGKQKIKLNPAVGGVRTNLPLPGPQSRKSRFPQEAYFEITLTGRVVVWVGLTTGETDLNLPLKNPGSYTGSIGFSSTGSLYLNGIKLAEESPKEECARGERVIGCGYNPLLRMVFFTVDSKLAHEVHCKSEEFGSPLYPTLATNTETTVSVNLGQAHFRYAPANMQRTSNPCSNEMYYPSICYEDRSELFSIGKIDALWRQRSFGAGSGVKGMDDLDDGDLFDIVLHDTKPH